jgi:hypothetical protein
MLNTLEALSYLGLAASEKKLAQYMNKQNVNLASELSLTKDEYGNYEGFDAYIERPKEGFCFIFTDEAEFFGLGDQSAGVGELYYSGMFFHSEGKDNYNEYKSDLPYSLSFNDTREDVLGKLGQQSWQRLAKDGVRVISDRWDSLPDVPYRLHVTYDKNTGKISIISASIPDKPLS